MPLINSDTFQLSVVQLNASGAVPTTPAMVRARLSGESLNFQPQTTLSSEIDPSGQLRDSVLTGLRSAGSIDMPVSRHTFFDDMLQAVMRGTWTSNVLNVGSTQREFMIEKRFVPPAGVAGFIYHRYNKASIASAGLTISPGNEITSSFSVMAGTMEAVETAIAGATYADPGTEPIFTAPQVTNISIAGITNSLCFNNLSIDLNSNLRGIECIGSLGYREFALGRFEATLRGTAYFVSNDLIDYLLNQQAFSCTVTIADSDNNSYTFLFPRCKMTNNGANAAGANQDVVSNIAIQALYDPVTQTTVRITRVIGV